MDLRLARTVVAAVLLAAGAPTGGQLHATRPQVVTDPVRLSTGCGQRPPPAPPSRIALEGRQRSLIVAVPDADGPPAAHRLVIAFHGLTNSNARARRYYDLERHASEPTIFVYPSGLPDGEGRYSWSDPGDAPHELRDYALFDALVARFAALYCIDLDRIWAVGHSLGAWFVNSLACARGDVVAAVATVAGGVSPSDCRGSTAAVLFHHPDDRLVPFSQGIEARDALLRANGLDPADGVRIKLDAFGCQRFRAPDAGASVVWCAHARQHTRSGRYYPHQWPPGASRAIMAFFQSL